MIDFQIDIQTIAILTGFAGAIILYFGKVISDTKVEIYNKIDLYTQGLFFSSTYILIPFLTAYYLLTKNTIISDFSFSFFIQVTIPGIVSNIFILLLIAYVLSLNIQANEALRKLGLIYKFQKMFNEKMKELKQKSWFGKFISNHDKDIKSRSMLTYNITTKVFGNRFLLWLFSFMVFLTTLSVVTISSSIIVYGVVVNFVILDLTMIALAFGYSSVYYPPATIYLTNNEKIEGKIIKFSNEFLTILKKDKILLINKDQISKITESVYKLPEIK